MDPLNLTLPWILEAKKHIGLKEIPGPKHNATILSWLTQLKAWWKEDETPWCFTGETEIFTEDGWIRLDELSNEQKVYQADENGKLSLTSIIRKIEKNYNGDAFFINHKNVRLTCDEGHRWWGHFGKLHTEKRFGTLNEVTENGLSVPNVCSGNNNCGLTMEQLWFLAAFISDGKLRYSQSRKNTNIKIPINVEFEVSKQRKIKQLKALKPDHFYVQNKVYGELTAIPLSVFRFTYPDYLDSCFDGYKSLSKQFINSLSMDDARIFLQAYATFDGNGDIFNNTILYTSDAKLLKDLTSICVLAGYHLSIQINKYGSEFTKKTAYRIVFSPDKKNRHIRKNQIQKIPFNGKMYCVEVPQGRIVVKAPNSSPIVTGNCGVFVAHCFRTSGMQLPKYWMRAKEWGNGWGTRLNKAVPGCVVVFEREGGGHVGFVLGITKLNELVVLGGNQGNAVNIAKFPMDRVFGFYWPRDYTPTQNTTMPILTVAGGLSVNEA